MKKFLIFLPLLFIAFPASAAITFNASATASSSGLSNTVVTSTINITGGANSIVIANVGFYTSGSSNTASATYNGVAMTLEKSATSSNSTVSNDWLFYLINPPSGNNIVSTTISGASKVITLSIGAYNGVNQTTPFGAVTSSLATTNPLASTSITTLSPNSWVLDSGTFVVSATTTVALTPGSNQTTRAVVQGIQSGNSFGAISELGDKVTTSTGVYGMNQTFSGSANLVASTYIVSELEAATVPTADVTLSSGVTLRSGVTIR